MDSDNLDVSIAAGLQISYGFRLYFVVLIDYNAKESLITGNISHSNHIYNYKLLLNISMAL